jgi:hypothetical protein
MSCGCGEDIAYHFHQLACMGCGAGCRPACAVQLESVTYCERCARWLLGYAPARPEGRFDLH